MWPRLQVKTEVKALVPGMKCMRDGEMGTEGSDHNRDTSGASPMTLGAVGAVGEWLSTVQDLVRQERERQQSGSARTAGDIDPAETIEKMIAHFEVLGVFVNIDMNEWAAKAAKYIDNIDNLNDADLLTLRKLLSYHRKTGGRNGHYLKIAMNGHLLRLLRRFQGIYREVEDRTLV